MKGVVQLLCEKRDETLRKVYTEQVWRVGERIKFDASIAYHFFFFFQGSQERIKCTPTSHKTSNIHYTYLLKWAHTTQPITHSSISPLLVHLNFQSNVLTSKRACDKATAITSHAPLARKNLFFDIHAHKIQISVCFEDKCKTTFSEMAGRVAILMAISMERQWWKTGQGNDADDTSAPVVCIFCSSYLSALLFHEIFNQLDPIITIIYAALYCSHKLAHLAITSCKQAKVMASVRTRWVQLI